MSTQIDNQIVKMEFDNKKFEEKTKTTLNTIQKLKKALNFDEQTKSMKELERAANKLTLDDIGATLDKLTDKFSVFGIAGMTVVQDLTRAFESFAKKTASALTAPLRQIENGGWARAMKIKDAEFTMKGLNILGDKLEAIKKDIDYAVSGTAYGYESAASAAAQFAASNVQIGDSMKTALRAISGIAAQTNSSYDDIAGIFTTIAGNGKVMTQQLRQLSFRGMNASATLAKSMHTSEAAIAELVRKGEISFDEFATAMDEAFGEHAKAANETFQGALDNMKASLSRVGADFATPWIDFQRDVFNSTRLILNSLRKETSAYENYSSNVKRVILDGSKASERDLANVKVMKKLMNDTKVTMNSNLNSMMQSYQKAKDLYSDTSANIAKLKAQGKTGTAEYQKQTALLKEYDKKVKSLKKSLKGGITLDPKGTAKAGTEIDKLTKKIGKFEKVVGTRDAAAKRIKELTAAGKTRTKEYADTLKTLNEYTKKAKELENEPIRAEKVLLKQLQSYVKDVNYYMGGAAENALDRAEQIKKKVDSVSKKIDKAKKEQSLLEKEAKNLYDKGTKTSLSEDEAKRLDNIRKQWVKLDENIDKLDKRLDKNKKKLKEAEEQAYKGTVVGSTNSVSRLVETYKRVLEGVRGEVLDFLNDPKLIYGINNFVDGLNYLLQFVEQFAQPFKNAWRSIFPKDEAAVIFNLTEKFKKFMQELRLSAEGSEKVESIFRGIAAALSILSTVVGDIVSVIGVLAKPAIGLLTDIFAALGEAVVTVEWRFRQFRAGVLAVVKYFTKVITESKTFEVILRGLSTVVSGVITVFTVLSRVIGTVLAVAIIAILSALDKLATHLDNVLEFVTPIGKALLYVFSTVGGLVVKGIWAIITVLSKFIKPAKEVGGLIRDLLVAGFTALSDAMKNFSIENFVENVLNKIKYIIEGIRSGVITIPQLIGGGISKAIETLGSIFSGVTGAIRAFFKEFTKASTVMASGNKAFKETKENTTGIIDKIKEFFAKIANSKALQTFGEALDVIKDKLSGFFNSITPAKLFAVAFTGAVVMMTIALFNLMRSISDFMTFTAQVPVAITGMLKSITGFFDALKDRVAPAKELSTQFKEIAEAIAIIAASIYVLGKMDPDALKQGAAAMVQIVVLIGLFYLALKGISMIPSKSIRSVMIFTKLTGSFIAMAVSIALVVGALNMLAKADFYGTADMFTKMLLVLGAMAGVATVMAIFSKYDKGITSSSLAILAFSASLYLIVKSFERLQGISWKKMYDTFWGILPVIGTLYVISFAISRITFSGGLGMILTVGAILLAIPIFKKISQFDFTKATIALQAFTVLIATIATIGMILQVITRKNVFESFESFGNGLKGVATAMILMTAAVFLLGNIRKAVLVKGITALGFMSLFIMGLEALAFRTNGNDMKQFGRSMLAIAAAMVIMSGLVAVLGSLKWEEIKKGLIAVGGITAMIAAIEWMSQYTKGVDSKGMGLMIALSVDILTLAGTLIVLAQLPWQSLVGATAAMSLTLLSFGKAVEWIFGASGDLKAGAGSFITLLEIAGIVFVLGSALGKMAEQDWKSLAAAGAAMGVALLAFGKAVSTIFRMSGALNKGLAAMLIIFELAGLVFVIGSVLGRMAKQDWKGLAAAGAAMGVALLAFAGAFMMISAGNLFINPDSIVKMAAEFVLLCVVMVGIGHVLGQLAQHDWKSIAASGASIAVVLVAMAVVIDLMCFVPVTAGIQAAIAIASFVGILAALIWLIDEVFSSGDKSGTEKIAEQIEKLGKIFGAFVDGFVTGATENIGEAGKRLSEFATNAKSFFDLMGTFKEEGSANGVEAMVKLFTAMAAAEFTDGLNVFGKLHEFFTGEDQITELGNDLVNMAGVMKDFQKEADSIDADKLQKQAESLATLVGAVSRIPSVTTTTTADGYIADTNIDYENFGNQLAKLGESLVTFQKNTKELKTSSIEKASTAMQMINAFCDEIPNSGNSVLSWIVGDNEVGDFAEGLELLGPALERFSMAAKFVDPTAVDGAVNCMGIIAAFCDKLPKEGGWDQTIKGSADLKGFAAALPDLGSNFKTFAENVKGVETGDAVNVANALKDLADAGKLAAEQGIDSFTSFAQSLPNATGSIKSFFADLADSDIIDTSKISSFGVGVRALCRIADDIKGTQYQAFLDLSDSISTLARTGLDVTAASAMDAFKSSMEAVITDINDKQKEIVEAGNNTIKSFVEGMGERVETVKTQAAKICILAKGEMADYYDTFFTVGKLSADNYARGLESSEAKKRVSAAAQTIADLASSGSVVSTDATESTMSGISTNIVNTLVGINDQASNFGLAANSLMNNFIGGLDAGITTLKDYGSKITSPITNYITSNDTLKRYKKAGSDATEQFAKGIASYSSKKLVVDEATKIGEAAVDALDKAIADPVGVSDETYRLGNAFSKGFGIGIKNKTRDALKAAADMGVQSIKSLDDAIHDPTIMGVEVSLDTFNLGKAAGAGYEKGIQIFNGAVKKAASILGLQGVEGIEDVVKNFESKVNSKGDSLLGNLFKAITGEKRKDKVDSDVKGLFGNFFDNLKDEMDKATEDANNMGAAIDNAKKTKDKKGKNGKTKSGAKWENSDLIAAMKSWLAVTEDFTVKYDAFNSKLLEKGKVTIKYLAQSAGGTEKLKSLSKKIKAAEKTLNSKKSSAKEKKQAEKDLKTYRKQYETEAKKTNYIRKAIMSLSEKDIKDLNKDIKKQAKAKGYKVGSKEYNKLVKDMSKDRLKSLESSLEVLNTKTKSLIKDKSLAKTLMNTGSYTKNWLKNYDAEFKTVNGIMSKYAERYTKNGGTSSKEYKKLTKEMKTEQDAINKIEKKIVKQQSIIDDPKATEKQKKAAKEKLKTYKKQKKNKEKDLKTTKKDAAKYEKEQEKVITAAQAAGEWLYKQTDEYKDNIKQLKKLAEKEQDLTKKANKQKKIINDKNATAAQKQAAKKRLANYESEVKDVKKQIGSISKAMAKGPGKALKDIQNQVKSAVKDFLSFANIDFSKTLEGFDRKVASTNLQSQAYDIFTHSMIDTTEAIKQATDAYGLLNVSIDTGINLLERFAKVSTTNPRRLMRNAESQLKAYKEYQNGLASLKNMGLSDEMINQLKAQGTSALSSIRGFLKMTPRQIQEYNNMVGESSKLQADAAKDAMRDQVKTYEDWLKDLAALTGKIPEQMLKELRSSGVSNADFVKTLLYMDQSTLNDISKMYEDGLRKSVDAAVQSVAEANENRSFKETIEKTVSDFAEKENIIAQLEEKGFSKALIEKFKTMGVSELRAYFKEFENETEEGVAKINEEYEKSLYGGKTAADKWIEDMTVTNDTYDEWKKNMKAIGKELGKDDPLYKALEDMGWEAGSEYAKAFVNASEAQKKLIEEQFERQQKENTKSITEKYQKRIDEVEKWNQNIKFLSEQTRIDKNGKTVSLFGKNFMKELIEAGPENAADVQALVDAYAVDPESVEKLSKKYNKAIKMDKSVSEEIGASYISLFDDAIDKGSKKAKSKESKQKVEKAVNETIEYTAKVCAPNARKSGKKLGKKIISGAKAEASKDKAKTLGENVDKGLAGGIDDLAYLVKRAAKSVAKKAYNAMKDELKVESPSKMTEELGKFVDLGFVSGLEAYAYKVDNAAVSMSDGMLEKLRVSMEEINDPTYQPTITPSFDLSGIANETAALSAQMSTTRDIVVTLNDKANEDVVNAIGSMNGDMIARLEALSHAMEDFNVYLDSGTLVGQLAGPMDSAMGKMMANRRRGM